MVGRLGWANKPIYNRTQQDAELSLRRMSALGRKRPSARRNSLLRSSEEAVFSDVRDSLAITDKPWLIAQPLLGSQAKDETLIEAYLETMERTETQFKGAAVA